MHKPISVLSIERHRVHAAEQRRQEKQMQEMQRQTNDGEVMYKGNAIRDKTNDTRMTLYVLVVG